MKQNLPIKKTIRFLKWFLIIFIAFLFTLFLIGNIAEKKITALAFNELKSSLEVPIESGDISFTLIRKFPLATFEFNNILVGSPGSSVNVDSTHLVSDTLINIEKLYISVKSTPLIDGVFDIQKVEVIGANIEFAIDKNGISNFDFLIDTTKNESSDTTSSDPLDLTLQKLLLKDITCYYSDSLRTTKAKIVIPEVTLKGKVKKEMYSGLIDGSVLLSECDFEDTYLDRMRETKVDFVLGLDNDSLKINAFTIVTDGAMITATGTTVIKDEIYSDVNIKGENINLEELMKYVPKDSLEKYNIKGITGIVSFDASIKGVISDSIQPSVAMVLSMKEGGIVTSQYPELKNVSFVVNATNGEQQNEETTKIDVRKFHFETENSRANITMAIKNLNRIEYDITSDVDINIPDFKQLIPDSLIKDISGNIKAQFATKGILPDSIDDDYFEYLLQNSRAKVMLSDVSVAMDSIPSVKSFSGSFDYHPGQFNATMVNMSVPDYHVNIKNSSFNTLLSGKLMQPENTAIDITSFVFNSDSSSFSGSASVQNLKAPTYKISSKIEINLAEIGGMLPDSLVKDMSGVITSTITSSGKLNLDSISNQINDIVFKQSSFTFNLNSVSVEMQDTMMCVNHLTGSMKIVPDTVSIDKLAGTYKSIDFDASSVKVVNLYNTVFKNLHEQLYVEGVFKLGDIDYAMFASLIDTTTTVEPQEESSNKKSKQDVTNTSVDNYTFLIKGKLSVNSFQYNKVSIENLSTLFNLKDSLYKIDKFTFDAFKGNMNSSIRVELKGEDEIKINTKHFVEGMDVKQLLEDFDDFSEYGNTYIESNNLSGILSTELYTQTIMVDDSIIMNKMRVKGAFKIENGGIYNYKPAMDMAEFTKLKELDNIKFKTLESKIFMFKNKLYVPSTDIVSSTLDVSFFGMQSMGDDYEYHVDLRLRDVLKGKSKKLLKRQAETGDDIDDKDLDRGSVNLIYADIDGKTKVGFDSKIAIRMMQLKIKVQLKMLNLNFNPKVVSFNTGLK